MSTRRDFITLLGGAAAWPVAARAQQPERLARIGFLGVTSAAQQAPYIDAFREGLRYLGYVEGRNLHIEFRFAEGDNDRLRQLAAELVRLNVDVIVTHASGVYAARRATATIPIVMASFTDPVALGLVPSLAHPGGNITGSTFFNPELMAKRLEFIKEVAPSMTQVGVFLFGHLEKLLSLPIADHPAVNVNESERQRSGIICRQFCDGRSVAAIFRGAHF